VHAPIMVASLWTGVIACVKVLYYISDQYNDVLTQVVTMVVTIVCHIANSLHTVSSELMYVMNVYESGARINVLTFTHSYVYKVAHDSYFILVYT
jgi:hypothetical protein